MAFDPDKYLKEKNQPSKGFDPDAYLSKQQPSVQPEVGSLAALARGAAQGATFGFEDELAGGLGAAKDILTGNSKLSDIGDAYRKNRDAERAANEAAEQQHPWLYGGGNIGGAIVPALLTAGTSAVASGASEGSALGRIANAMRIGAKAGAVGGLGTSTSDLSKGDVGGTLKDVIEGTGSGILTGGLLQGGIETAKGVGQGLKSLANDSKIVQNFKKSYNLGTEGTNLATDEGRQLAQQNVTESAKKLGLQSKEALQGAGAEVGSAKDVIRQSGQKFDVSDEIKQIQDLVEKLKQSDNPDALQDINKLQGYLDNLLKGKETEVPIQYSKFTPGKAIEASPSAQEALEQEAAKAKASAQALGQNLNTSIIPSEDDQGNRLLTLLKNTNEQVGASERAIPIKDADGNIITTKLDEGDLASNFSNKASAKTVYDTPAVEQGFTPSERGPVISETKKLRQGGINPTEVDYNKAEDIKNTLNNFNGVGNSGTPRLNTNEAINQSKLTAKSINTKIAQSPELQTANQKYSAANQALDTLGISPDDFVKDAQTGKLRLDIGAEQKLKNNVRRYSMETASGANAEDKVNDALRLLSVADPEKAAALQPEIQKNSQTLDLAYKAQGLGLLNRSTYLKAGPIRVGNFLGRTVKSISDATPVEIQNIARDLTSKGAMGMKLASELADSLKKDNIGRNAALFTLQQNPEYRKMLGQYIGDNKEGTQ